NGVFSPIWSFLHKSIIEIKNALRTQMRAFSECLRATQKKFAYYPSEKPLLLFFACCRNLLASVYERSIDTFALKKA
ncbi:hypothetical protein ACG9XW_22970, partial [Acinetobacter guillouiae]|uniref:hypothetical protein n=1 Tax=Acinetobacter guillouiae TaxID=106649 RepID=UPI003AF7DB0D